MRLDKKCAHTGRWLFRWRSYLPLALLGIVLPALRTFHYPLESHTLDMTWDLICLFISTLGLVIRGYTVGHVPQGTSGRNTKNQVANELNYTGMYSICRNPLYLGNFLMGLGPMLFVREWWVPALYVCLFWLYYERIILAEEQYLADKFGKTYEEYCLHTPVFLPRLSLWKPPALPFSFRTVLKREYSGLFGLLATFMFLELVGDYRIYNRLVLDRFWTILFTLGAVLYVVLRVLKKHTHWLDVPGR